MGTISITAAKRELYERLKTIDDVVGAGIKGGSTSEYIVIFVRHLSAKTKAAIPDTYKGIKVKLEKRSMAKVL
jgi:hypothetical protein